MSSNRMIPDIMNAFSVHIKLEIKMDIRELRTRFIMA